MKQFANIQQIAQEFDNMIPVIADNFESVVGTMLNTILSTYGSEVSGPISTLTSKFSQDAAIWRQFRSVVDVVDVNGVKSTKYRAAGNKYVINSVKLNTVALKYARFEVEKFKCKLVNKLVDLTDISDLNIQGNEFSFNAKLNDYNVRVEQTTVLKTSNKGKLFNQWPCRIYVNDKFMSEAKFKELCVL